MPLHYGLLIKHWAGEDPLKQIFTDVTDLH